MKKISIHLFCLLLILTGCGDTGELDQEKQKNCEELGYTAGTADYESCKRGELLEHDSEMFNQLRNTVGTRSFP